MQLRCLFPAARDLHRHYVVQVIRQEQVERVEGRIGLARTERQIAAAVREAFGARLFARTVAYIRRDSVSPDRASAGGGRST